MPGDDLETRIGEITDEDITLSNKLRRRRTSISALAGIAAGAWINARSDNIYAAALATFCTYILTEWLFQPFNRLTQRGFINSLRSMYLGFGMKYFDKIDIPKNLKYYAEAAHLTKDPLAKCRLIAQHDSLQGNRERAFKRYLTLLTAHDKSKRISTPFELLAWSGEGIGMDQTKALQNSPTANIEACFLWLGRGIKGKSVDKAFTKACNLVSPLQIETNCLYGYFLDQRNKQNPTQPLQKKAKTQWEKTIDLILDDPTLKNSFRKIGESKNEVLEITGSELIKDTFVFKRSPSVDDLERGFKLSNYMHNAFAGSDDVLDPLHFAMREKLAYAVLRRVMGEPLTDVDEETAKSAIGFMQNAHRKMESHKEELRNYGIAITPRDHRKFLEKRYIRRIQDSKIQEQLMQATGFLTDKLGQQRRYVVHGDFHPNNLLKREEGFTLIDYDHMTLATRLGDLAKFMESHHLCLSVEGIQQGVQWYAEASGSKKSNDETMLEYAYNATQECLYVHGALAKASYGMDPIALEKAKEWYKQRAVANLRIIAATEQREKESTSHLEELIHAA